MTSTMHPHSYAAAAAKRCGVRADIIHSTSWRMDAGRVVLTYLVVTSHPLPGKSFDVHQDHVHLDSTPPDHVTGPPADLATATTAPVGIGAREVLHHAIHHLALLARTNPSVMSSLSRAALDSLLPLAPAGAGVLPFLAYA